LVARVLSTHRMTAGRIRTAQNLIQRRLEPRPEYVVNTSEFDNIRARLRRLEDLEIPRGKGDGPVLHRRLGGTSATVDAPPGDTAPKPAKGGK